MKALRYSYLLSVLSLLGMMILVIVWNGWLATEQSVPKSFEIAVFCIPLVLFLRGILNGKRAMHVALMVLAFFYFMAGISFVVTPVERAYGVAMTLLSLGMYLGGYYYAKNHDKLAQARLDAEEAKSE
ncbi:DUF2069 domain-containing protein [Leucothrix arctica]|uniref:DUF2069 domain-containing protein n=1 Tax=Leucothrix arctica TaxID=1481894 RepID=A0A317CGC3_9GAMM|nr:DUF2069 domain-containing protein [Leucothrix arctica]PWQ97419.1 hypothetical protein DKT75_06840 [Leucothrix arctica]